jgi:hypothetical protein
MSAGILSDHSLGAIPVASVENKRSAEPSLQVTTCQLETHPGAYDHKLVEARGRVYFGKFDFVIDSTVRRQNAAGADQGPVSF